MRTRRATLLGCLVTIVLVAPGAARAQQSVADLLGRPATPEGGTKTYLEELMLYSYIENSFVWNLRTAGRGDVNELRFYDHDNGYTFNVAELSVKKDPSERYRLGYGVVITAGLDSQKNHSLGIFRDRDDQPPFFRNTEKFDLPEPYPSFLPPVRTGPTLQAIIAFSSDQTIGTIPAQQDIGAKTSSECIISGSS